MSKKKKKKKKKKDGTSLSLLIDARCEYVDCIQGVGVHLSNMTGNRKYFKIVIEEER